MTFVSLCYGGAEAKNIGNRTAGSIKLAGVLRS